VKLKMPLAFRTKQVIGEPLIKGGATDAETLNFRNHQVALAHVKHRVRCRIGKLAQ
jgi:hypothetical protein